MQPDNKLSLPFLTRDMLAFEESATFQLVIESRSDATSIVNIRGATKEGPFTLSHSPLNTKALKTETFNIPDIPIFISVDTAATNYNRGNCYVALSLRINGNTTHRLVAGYVYGEVGLTWPATSLVEPTTGIGLLQSIIGTDPAAGAEAILDIPSGEMWKVHDITIGLDTAATAGSRRVHMTLDYGAGRLLNFISPVDQIISESKQYNFYPGAAYGATADDNDIIVPLPIGLIAPATSRFKTATTNRAAGDQFTTFAIRGERFFTPI